MAKPDTITMSMEMFERIDNAVGGDCDCCAFTNICNLSGSCTDTWLEAIKKDNEEKGIKDGKE